MKMVATSYSFGKGLIVCAGLTVAWENLTKVQKVGGLIAFGGSIRKPTVCYF